MTFRIDRFLHHIPEIERRIRELRPDAIVFGLGPTAWLLPWIDNSLLHGVRLWTCHDGCRILPAHDLVLMDGPVRALHPDTIRYETIVKSRPERLWIFPRAWEWRGPGKRIGEEKVTPQWSEHLPEPLRAIAKVQKWREWNPVTPPTAMKPVLGLTDPKDGSPLPETFGISPTGCTTLAWALGARRIGVIGADMLKEHGHSSFPCGPSADVFFAKIAAQASVAGGAIRNLSPVSSLKTFEESWTKLSASGSAPTNGSAPVVPSESSNTASASTPPVQSSSTGCAAAIPAGKSAS